MTAIAKKGGIIGIWPLLRRRDTLETYLRSIDYVKNLVGADHLGIATDLFGLAGSSAVPSHKEFAIIPAVCCSAVILKIMSPRLWAGIS